MQMSRGIPDWKDPREVTVSVEGIVPEQVGATTRVPHGHQLSPRELLQFVWDLMLQDAPGPACTGHYDATLGTSAGGAQLPLSSWEAPVTLVDNVWIHIVHRSRGAVGDGGEREFHWDGLQLTITRQRALAPHQAEE